MTLYVQNALYNERNLQGGEKMQNNSENKAERVLSIYSKLKHGNVIRKAEHSEIYGVSERTIQRDIADVQCFLSSQENETGDIQEVIYDKNAGGYRLETKQKTHLNAKEILAVGKVLLESRSLTKQELFPIINSLVRSYGDETDCKTVQNLLNNEMFHFVELQHKQLLLDKIWNLEQAVKEQRYVEISYQKLKNKEIVTRKLKPVGIMFSEFYFYLTAYMEDAEKEKYMDSDNTFPTIYRIDRILEYRILDEHFRIPYAKRFEEGEFRKRVQFMYGGRLRNIKLKCTDQSMEAVLDKFPTAKVIKKDEDGYLVQVEVFGDGVEMWLRGQRGIEAKK